jgi:RNA polymerase sigma-70 factor (ECF subfamily)
MTDPSGTNDKDVALLTRIAEGGSDAVVELYDRHAALLYSVLLHMLGDEAEAELVLQDLFIQVREQVGSYHRYLGTVAAWLIGLARYRAVERLRGRPSHARLRERDETGAALRGVRLDRGPDQQVAAIALASLPAEERELIEQAFFLGCDLAKLAARHRLPIGIVESHIRTGMTVLLDQLPYLSGVVQE